MFSAGKFPSFRNATPRRLAGNHAEIRSARHGSRLCSPPFSTHLPPDSGGSRTRLSAHDYKVPCFSCSTNWSMRPNSFGILMFCGQWCIHWLHPMQWFACRKRSRLCSPPFSTHLPPDSGGSRTRLSECRDLG